MTAPTRRAASLIAEELNRQELEVNPEGENEQEEEADSDYESGAEDDNDLKRMKMTKSHHLHGNLTQHGLSDSQKKRGEELFQQLFTKVQNLPSYIKANQVLKTLYLEEVEEEPFNPRKKKFHQTDEWIDPLLSSYVSTEVPRSLLQSSDRGLSNESLAIARECLKTFGTTTVQEQVKFAGETVAVAKKVEKSKLIQEQQERQQNKRGLDEMIEGISKKRGITTVEKSSYDWEKYKEEKNLKDELKDASKAGYVEKQEFLHRVDERQFEQEKATRERERAIRDANAPKRSAPE
jgi:hypothetical protein